MSYDFFSINCGLSDQNGFTGNALDRLGEQRDTLDGDALFNHPGAAFHVMAGSRQLVKSVTPYSALFTLDEVERLNGELSQACLLGLRPDGTPEFAIAIPRQEQYAGGFEAIDLRAIARQGTLADQELGATAQGRSLLSWHKSHGFCPRCGEETRSVQLGYARRCDACEMNHFPRTDPVAIMLAIDGERCLLGRSPSFPEKMVSALAGFIEVGETMEEAVRREILEESGVQTHRVRYHSTQPWPFPSSLMIGCYAEATSTAINTDDELELCAWFTRDEVRDILENTHKDGFWAPPKTAIAHQLMKGFVEGV